MGQSHEESFGVIPLRYVDHEWNVFIILHKQGNHWGFPKGKANQGEDPKKSAERELLEETGLKVERFLLDEPFIEEYSFFRNSEKIVKNVFYFPALVAGAFILQPQEIREGKWLSFEKAMQQLTFDEAKNICKRIKRFVEIMPDDIHKQ